jgi:hypothetical protein
MARFDSGTSISTLLGLKVLFSIGVGIGPSQMVWAGLTTELLKRVRERGPPRDVMRWISFAIFAEMLGASVGISIAQTVFTTQLSREVKANNLEDLLHSGVTNFREGLNSEQLDIAIVVFNTAITRTFYVATAAGAWPFGLAALILLVCIPISPCLFLMWRRRRARSHVVDNLTFAPPAEIPAGVPAELAAETSSISSQSTVSSVPVSETNSSPEHGTWITTTKPVIVVAHRCIIRPCSHTCVSSCKNSGFFRPASCTRTIISSTEPALINSKHHLHAVLDRIQRRHAHDRNADF